MENREERVRQDLDLQKEDSEKPAFIWTTNAAPGTPPWGEGGKGIHGAPRITSSLLEPLESASRL